MTLTELSKLPKNQLRVIDKVKERSEPLKWKDKILIIYGESKSKVINRYSGYIVGLCDGSHETVDGRGGAKGNAGRKPKDSKFIKVPIKIGIEQWKVDKYGGKKEMQNLLSFYVSKLK